MERPEIADDVVRQYVDTVEAERDRFGSLVGVAYQPDGAVRAGLEGAVLQQDAESMRQQVQAVLNFLRDNNPFA